MWPTRINLFPNPYRISKCTEVWGPLIYRQDNIAWLNPFLTHHWSMSISPFTFPARNFQIPPKLPLQLEVIVSSQLFISISNNMVNLQEIGSDCLCFWTLKIQHGRQQRTALLKSKSVFCSSEFWPNPYQ